MRKSRMYVGIWPLSLPRVNPSGDAWPAGRALGFANSETAPVGQQRRASRYMLLTYIQNVGGVRPLSVYYSRDCHSNSAATRLWDGSSEAKNGRASERGGRPILAKLKIVEIEISWEVGGCKRAGACELIEV